MVSPSRGTSLHGFGIDHGDGFLQRVGHALPALELRALIGRQFVPARLLRANRRGTIDLGQAIDMRQLDADAFGAFEHGDRRRGAGDQSDHALGGCALRRIRGVDQRVVDDRRAAHVGDAVLSISSKIFAGSTLRRQTLMPAAAAMVQGKHQPLQWNIGSVQR